MSNRSNRGHEDSIFAALIAPFRKHESIFNSPRTGSLLVLFLVLALLWCGRLLYLQVIKAPELSEEAANSRTISYDISPRRGTIYDRNGSVLASSIDAQTIYVNPNEIEDADGTAQKMAEILKGEKKDYLEICTLDTTFAYVERRVDMDVAERLQEEDLPGVYFIDDSKRVYPNGRTAAQVVGLVDIDGKGISGLELYYDDILSGKPGKVTRQVGKNGIPLPGENDTNVPAVDGQDIVISIDIGMQNYVEERLAEGVEEIGGKDGTVTLMDAVTGEIVAIASTPYFDPSNLSNVEPDATQLKSITSAYEPGSVFKAVGAMALLEDNLITPDDVIHCPAVLKADEYNVSDAHEREDMDMSFRTIMNESSNVGISLAVEGRLGFDKLYENILNYGLNEPTGVDYPGEAGGYLADQSQWSKIQSYNVSFGQGVMVTPLQMTRFYAALRNDGVAPTPHFLMAKPQTAETVEYKSERIIDNTGAVDTMVDMLTTVVEDGTGKYAAIDGFDVAGKTGTAEVASDEGGYKKGVYNLDFVGFIPNSTTSLVCFVGVNEVPYERQTTEVFHDIMENAIERYKVAPLEE